jgi:DNA helicase-2/ATP-dependent DNA helicase PcrA
MDLSEAQRQAVEYLGGPQIILAGAGSGKTRVIVAKAQYLIEQKGYSPDSLLVLTYSRKTQAELEERMEALGPNAPEVSTFHSFGLDVIREFSHLSGLSGEVDKADEFRLHRYRMRAISELSESTLLQTTRPGDVYSHIGSFIRRAKDELVTPSEIISRAQRELHSLPEDPSDDDDEMAIKRDRWTRIYEASRIYQSYERIKSEGAGGTEIDYEDMIVLCRMLLNTERIVGAKLRQRINYILVDEFQDTNYAQVEILHLLCNDKIGITVVGDDDQAIYRFRGASFGSFKLFDSLFENAQTHRLEENYRSTENVVNAAQAVIETVPEARFDPGKRMFARRYKGGRVAIRLCPDYQPEAESVAAEIAALLEDEKYQGPKSIAVLFRARRHKDLLQKVLLRRGIDFYYDRNIEEAPSPSMRLLKALYEFVVDDSRADNLAYIISHFIPDIGPQTERDILYRISRSDTGPLETLREIAGGSDENLSSVIGNLLDMIDNFRDMKKTKGPLGLLESIITETGVLAALMDDGRITDKRAFSEIASLLRLADEFAAAADDVTHAAFLEFLEWKEKTSDNDTGTEETSAVVILQTVHGSKGLEYPVVFVIGLSGRRFPPSPRGNSVEFPEELYKDEVPEGDVRIQEERRLFYVAMTRAKEKLYLYGVEKKNVRRSQFIKELTGAPFFEEVGELEIVEEPESMAAIPEIGPAKARDKSKSVIIPGSLPVRKALDDALFRLWLTSSSGSQTEGEFEKAKAEFKADIESALHSIKERIDDQKFVPREDDYRFKVDRISYTDLQAFDDCPLKFYYQKILRLPTPPTPALLLGQVIHNTLEWGAQAAMEGNEPALDALIAEFESRWRKIRLSDPDQKERMRQRGADLLDTYLQLNEELDGAPFALERKFEVELPSAILTGRIDRVDRSKSGLTVIDYKTGKKDVKKLKKDLQLPIYALACKDSKLFGEYPTKVMFMFLGDGTTHSDKPDPGSMPEISKRIEQKIQAINESDFVATPGSPCRMCGYSRICPASTE